MQDKIRVVKVIVEKIISYCDEVEKFQKQFGGTYEEFNANSAFQMAGSMCIVQIGELISKLPEDFKEKHSEIEWRQIRGMRHILVHDYYHVNLKILWNALTRNIPKLKKDLQKICSELLED